MLRASIRLFAALAAACLTATSLAAQSDKPSWVALPAIGSAPETGFQFGAVAMRVSHPGGAERPTVNQGYVLATAKHQYQLSLSHDGWTPGNAWRRWVQLDLLDYPMPFFGIGAEAPDAAEEWFTAKTVQLQWKLQRRMHGAWYAMFTGRALRTTIADTVAGGAVARGARTGSLTGARGGTIVQPGVGFSYDTRDDVIGAEHGLFVEAWSSVAARQLGSDFATNRTQIETRAYHRVGPGVIAAQTYLELNSGWPAFDQTALVGSDGVLRGTTKGRYRDRALAAAQVEWRAPLFWKIRYAAFAGIGAIGTRPEKLGALSIPSVGAGLRYRLFKNERSAIRLDYALGRPGQSGFYISLNEAF